MDPVFMILAIEVEEEEQREMLRLERRHLRDHGNVFELPEREFIRCYRLNKDLVRNLINELMPHMAEAQRLTKISITTRILGALRFFAQGSYQRSIGNERHVSMAQQTFSKTLSEVCSAIGQIAHRWIHFPITQDEKEAIKIDFMREFGFPGVIGCIDCTHVAIVQPSHEEHLYFNRKGYHSKNVQIISNSNLLILNVKANFGGATHDAFVWRDSQAREHLEASYQQGERNSWLLGDSGYPQEPWLMTPIRNVPPHSPQGRYTTALVRARNCVERTIGVLKMRFRCTLKERVLHYNPEKAGEIINAVCVLHNMCIRGNVPLEEDENFNEEYDEADLQGDHIIAQHVLALGQQHRAELINLYFN